MFECEGGSWEMIGDAMVWNDRRLRAKNVKKVKRNIVGGRENVRMSLSTQIETSRKRDKGCRLDLNWNDRSL